MHGPPLTPPRQRALERVRQIVLEALADQDARVYLFGSGVAGALRRGSDIDVAIEPRKPLPPGLLAELREALEESTIPYEVDLVDLSGTAPAFRERVSRQGIVWKD